MRIRPQYHLRDSDRGLLAWDVEGLIERTVDLQPIEIPLTAISELDEPHWFTLEGDSPTCRKVAGHAKLIEEADLSYPIIVDHERRVMDGMHRICKALNLGLKTILAYQLPRLPEPDYIGVALNDLPFKNNEQNNKGCIAAERSGASKCTHG